MPDVYTPGIRPRRLRHQRRRASMIDGRDAAVTDIRLAERLRTAALARAALGIILPHQR
jgi:hypothetical protein